MFFTVDPVTKKAVGKIEWRLMYVQKKLPQAERQKLSTPRKKLNFSTEDLVSYFYVFNVYLIILSFANLVYKIILSSKKL